MLLRFVWRMFHPISAGIHGIEMPMRSHLLHAKHDSGLSVSCCSQPDNEFSCVNFLLPVKW